MHVTEKPQKFPYARQSAGPAPLRRPGSVRRTTSIDSEWPQGYGYPSLMVGTARDIYTPPEGGAPIEIARGTYRLTCSPRREILALDVDPPHPHAQNMVGVRAGGASRLALGEHMGDIRGTPLFQIMDDFAGASLVAGWVWSQWREGWPDIEVSDPHAVDPRKVAGKGGSMIGVCTGFTPGASSLLADGTLDHELQSATDVEELVNSADPDGWHPMPIQEGIRMRRARRIDVWREGGLLRVDAGFQDSGPNPRGTRTAIHEYRVYAEIDEQADKLVSLQALPLILPFQECPGASMKASRMVGASMSDLREAVLDVLAGIFGCTHLNDVLRALADVPKLASYIR